VKGLLKMKRKLAYGVLPYILGVKPKVLVTRCFDDPYIEVIYLSEEITKNEKLDFGGDFNYTSLSNPINNQVVVDYYNKNSQKSTIEYLLKWRENPLIAQKFLIYIMAKKRYFEIDKEEKEKKEKKEKKTTHKYIPPTNTNTKKERY